jgi:hypothetical protein
LKKQPFTHFTSHLSPTKQPSPHHQLLSQSHLLLKKWIRLDAETRSHPHPRYHTRAHAKTWSHTHAWHHTWVHPHAWHHSEAGSHAETELLLLETSALEVLELL